MSSLQNDQVNNDLDAIKSGIVNKVYPILKPGDWIGVKAGAVCQILVGTEENPNVVIGYGYDAPSNFVFLNFSDYADQNALKQVITQAYENLYTYEVELNEVVPNKVIIIDGSDFCSEKILDAGFMKALQDKMGGKELTVSIPRRRCMMVTTAFEEQGIREQFLSVHQGTWDDDSYGNPPIINALFKVADGRIVGVQQL